MIFLICISQTARINIEVVSARQLAFLENFDKTFINNNSTDIFFQFKEAGLSIKLNQAVFFQLLLLLIYYLLLD
jgi:hypothetical protein